MDQGNLSLTLKLALEAVFMFLCNLATMVEYFFAEEKLCARHALFMIYACDETGSRSQFGGSDLESGSGSLFEGGVTKLALGVCFAAFQCENRVIDFD